MIVDAYLINWARWYFVRTTAPPARSKTPTSTPGNLLKKLKPNSILLLKVNSPVKYLGSDVMYITRQLHFRFQFPPKKTIIENLTRIIFWLGCSKTSKHSYFRVLQSAAQGLIVNRQGFEKLSDSSFKLLRKLYKISLRCSFYGKHPHPPRRNQPLH